MDETRTAAQTEQARVRLAALGVHLGALVIAAVLVALGAPWSVVLILGVIAASAGAWALKLYGDLQAQELQRSAVAAATRRFAKPDEFEG
jgi:hypothetical protein